MYRIHFTDEYGTGSFEVDTREEAHEAMTNLNADIEHPAWDIWLESYNYEEGYWEA